MNNRAGHQSFDARVYEVDEMEIDYSTPSLGLTNNSESDWIQNIDWSADDDMMVVQLQPDNLAKK